MKQEVINYGIFETKTLEQQYNESGMTLGEKAEFCEKLRVAFNLARMHLATDSQVGSMFKKLTKKVGSFAEPIDEVNHD